MGHGIPVLSGSDVSRIRRLEPQVQGSQGRVLLRPVSSGADAVAPRVLTRLSLCACLCPDPFLQDTVLGGHG